MSSRRIGLTLIELLVVIGILAIYKVLLAAARMQSTNSLIHEPAGGVPPSKLE